MIFKKLLIAPPYAEVLLVLSGTDGGVSRQHIVRLPYSRHVSLYAKFIHYRALSGHRIRWTLPELL